MHGWNATAYQILNPGITYWFSSRKDAVIGYVCHAGVRIVAGAPVCDHQRLVEIVAEFEFEAARAGQRVCYFGAQTRMEQLFRNHPTHSTVLLGAQPAWRPQQWGDIVRTRASLRAQIHRARNKSVSVTEWSPELAHEHPTLRQCLNEWLKNKGLPPLHFLIEPKTLARLFDRRVFVAERDGHIAGFLVTSPIPQRNGWLVEQIIRSQRGPNGTSEILIDAAVQSMATAGNHYVTLGLSPLSRRADFSQNNINLPHHPLWLRFVFGWVRAHGQRFYNFDGLDAFKSKFQPEWWEPVFAISNEPNFSLQTLYAIASAFTNGTPITTILKALVGAAQTEIRWMIERVNSPEKSQIQPFVIR